VGQDLWRQPGTFPRPFRCSPGQSVERVPQVENHAIELRKVKSLVFEKSGLSKSTVELPGGVELKFDKDFVTHLTDVVSAYFALRTLVRAWAFVGNYLVTSKLHSCSPTPMISLTPALAYADEALRLTM
jgi:hypothetical protein